MPTFVSSTSIAKRPGVYALERQSPATIRATGSSVTAFVEQFPWGPDQAITNNGSMKERIGMFAPAGMSHTGSGYLQFIRKGWPTLRVVRVLGSAAAKATATILKTGPASMLTLTLKYKGTAGNSVTATVSAASDGDANHFNLSVSVSGATGMTTDLFQNLNYSGTGADSTPSFASTFLIGGITKIAGGLPTPGTYTFSGGLNGSITSAEYVGTPTTADMGIALFESDKTVDGICVGDPGDGIRLAVNEGLVAHADLMTDRIAYFNGDSGQTGDQARAYLTDNPSLSSLRAVCVDAWAFITDDTDGTTRLVAPAGFAASVAAQLPASLDIGARAAKVKAMLGGISALEADRGDSAADNTAAGIVTLIKDIAGGFAFELGVVTAAPGNPGKDLLTRSRMGHYIARSVTASLAGYVNAPNVPVVQQDEVNAVSVFLQTLKDNAKRDVFNLPFIVDFFINDLQAANSPADVDAGLFTIPADVTTAPTQQKIFLSLNYGPTVTVSATL